MVISPQKKVGIIIIALLLLGVVALVQTGKMQIPGLESDALNTGNCTGTLPEHAVLQPGDANATYTVWNFDEGAGPYAGCTFKCQDGYAYQNNTCNEYTDVPHIINVGIVLENSTTTTPRETYVHYMIQGTGFGIGGTVNIDNDTLHNEFLERSTFGQYAYLNYQHVLENHNDPFSNAGTHTLSITNRNGTSNVVTFSIPNGVLPSTKPKIYEISPSYGKIGDKVAISAINFSPYTPNTKVILRGQTGVRSELDFDSGFFTIPDKMSDGSDVTPGNYSISVKNPNGEESEQIMNGITVISSVIIPNCPQLTPPAPDFCKDGKVVDGGKDNNNCPLTPKCLPKASLTANDVSELSLPLGTPLSYKWTSSSNAVSATSTYTTNKTTCSDKGVLSGTWTANTLNGSVGSHILPAKYLGCSYTITFTVKDASGNTDSSVLKLNIVDPPAPTATLKVNGSTGSVTARVGDRVKYEWSSTNAASASSSFTTNKASCGTGGVWFINKPNGALLSPPLPVSYAGCVFTLNFTANQTNTGKKATSTVVMTVQ